MLCMNQSLITHSIEETHAFAKKIAEQVKNGGVLALQGNLGAGKTTFTQGLAKALRIEDKILSPTFVVMRQHQIPNSETMLYHIDLYRMTSVESLKELGLEEILSNPKNIVVIEWPEKLSEKLPSNTLFLQFRTLDDDSKEIVLSQKIT
jgi:tRNA threonylcarbamoyladenosine biosynthesis protein TsaE